MTTEVGKLSFDQGKVLGQGSFGTLVFNGFLSESSNSMPVAVKRVVKRRDDVNIDGMQSEVKLMEKAGDHPNILRYIHTEMNSDYLFIAMEVCSGTLKEYVNGACEGVKFENEKEIVRQVTEGLAHLHKKGIIHRDIKPANILIFIPPSDRGTESKPLMKLADFGISKVLVDGKEDFTNTSTTNPNGTGGWMAPEVYEMKRFDFKVDVWALDFIFGFTLSGGKHPFGDDDLYLRTTRIRQKEQMVLTKDDLKENSNHVTFELIKRMLAVEPNSRPTATAVLNDYFFKDNKDRKNLSDQFLSVTKSLLGDRALITDEKIAQFKELVKDETVYINATTMTPNDEEMTPLHLICHYYKGGNLIELMKDLLLNGADVNAKAIKVKITPYRPFTGLTPLHLIFVVRKNCSLIDIVQLLLENGADVNAKNEHGDTPVHYACFYYRDLDDMMGIVRLFIQKDADLNVKNKDGRTPLHHLFSSNKCDNLMAGIARLLINHGADVNVKEENKFETPFHYLCQSYTPMREDKDIFMSLVSFLVDNRGDINARDQVGKTPSHILFDKGISLQSAN